MLKRVIKSLCFQFFRVYEGLVLAVRQFDKCESRHEIKYCSQHSPHISNYWRPRVCALACVNMVLSLKRKDKSLNTLIKRGLELDGYHVDTDVGWFHKSLSIILREEGFENKIMRFLTLRQIIGKLSIGGIVIASVRLKNNIDHMLLITGYELDQKNRVKGIFLFDPSRPNLAELNKPVFMKCAQFLKLFNFRGIVVDQKVSKLPVI